MDSNFDQTADYRVFRNAPKAEQAERVRVDIDQHHLREH